MQDDSYCVWKCDLCDKKFPNKSMLTRHRTHKHEALFRFECSKCLKRLASNKLLKLHMTQHTGEKPYSCDFCDYKVELVTKELNHLAAILHVYARGLNFMR